MRRFDAVSPASKSIRFEPSRVLRCCLLPSSLTASFRLIVVSGPLLRFELILQLKRQP